MMRFYLFIFLLISTALTQAEEKIKLTPKVYTAYRDFDYSAGITGVQGQVFSLGLGLTSTYKRFYTHIFTERNLSPTQERTTNLVANTIHFERKDSSISLGYALNSTISVFTGYKMGETAITALDGSDLQGNFIRLSAKGGFIGAGAGFPINKGILSFSAGFAWMQATYKQSNEASTKGNATGASLSIHWQAPITDKLAYEVGLFRHSYFYDKLDQSEGSINEHIVSIRAGLSYRF